MINYPQQLAEPCQLWDALYLQKQELLSERACGRLRTCWLIGVSVNWVRGWWTSPPPLIFNFFPIFWTGIESPLTFLSQRDGLKSTRPWLAHSVRLGHILTGQQDLDWHPCWLNLLSNNHRRHKCALMACLQHSWVSVRDLPWPVKASGLCP